MKDKFIRILSTRPLDKALSDKALEQNIIIDNISFIKTEEIVDANTSDQIKKLATKPITAVFTSMNGVEAVAKSLNNSNFHPEWKIYCIGAATQYLITSHFSSCKIIGTGKNAAELSQAIINDKAGKVVFFCGDQRRDELPALLRDSKITVEEIVVYKTKEVHVKIEKDYNGILFFSPSAVKSFFSLNSIPPATVLFSIGNTTADAIKSVCENEVIISDFPAKEKLVEMAIQHFLNESET